MASLSPHRSLSSLGIQELNDVLELLKECGFSETRWFELGLALGLSYSTLDTIKANYPQNTRQCLIECLSKWLVRADDVDSKGGTTWDSLSAGLRSINENAVADKLDKEKRPNSLAISIFDDHHHFLAQSLSDPVNVAFMLHREGILTKSRLNHVEAVGLSPSNRCNALLTAMREAVLSTYSALKTFAHVLITSTENKQLGEDINRHYEKIFPRNDYVPMKVQLDTSENSDGINTSQITVEIYVPLKMVTEFSSIRVSFGRMLFCVHQAIKKKPLSVEDVKDFIRKCTHNRNLKLKLERCDSISSVLRAMEEEEYSLIDMSLLKALVEVFEITEAEKHIKKYDETLNDFCANTSATLCLEQKFAVADSSFNPPLKCETATYVFHWKPDDIMLNDIISILSKSSDRSVKIRTMNNCSSVAVICKFPYSLTGVLIARVMENMQFLKDNGLMRLTIGYWTIWEKEKASQKEIELSQEQNVLLTIKSDQDEHVKLLELKDTIHQLMDTLTTQKKLCTEKLSELKQEIEPASVAVLEEEIKALTIQVKEQKMTNEYLSKRLEISQQKLTNATETTQREQEQLASHLIEMKKKEQIQQERDDQVQEKAALIKKFHEDMAHFKETKATLKEQNKKLQKELQEEKHLMSRLMKQKGKEVKTDTVSKKDEEIESLKNKLEEERKDEKKLRQELQEKVESLEQQLQQFIIPQSDLTDSSITVAGHGLLHLNADDHPSSFNWDKYGFRLHCPEGAVSKDTAVAVTPLLSNQFEVPKGTVLVSAVYKIEVLKPLSKRVVIELQHCVDLRNTGQTGCLKFVRAPLKSPYQFGIIDGGVFHIGNRYGSIEHDDFCAMGIVAEMSNDNGTRTGMKGDSSNSENNVTLGDILYTGMMYHEKKRNGYWKTTYSIAKDLEAVKQYNDVHSTAEVDNVVYSFKFVQPNGTLRLILEAPQQLGWTVDPHMEPMMLLQSIVNQLPTTNCSMSIYAEPGVAKEPLHCPIILTGIVPESTIYINRPPPPPPPSSNIDNTTSTSSTTGASTSSKETEESTFRPDVAYKVMKECTGMIKERVGLYPLINKLVEKRMISEAEKDQVTDQNCGLNADQRMDKLLGFVKASIKEDGEDFGLFIEIIKQENTRRADRLAQTLLDTYKRIML